MRYVYHHLRRDDAPILQVAARECDEGETDMGYNQPAAEFEVGTANIKVLGVGGAGCNMTNWLYKKGVKGA
jgi:cell division GTPase FtsZ